MKKHFLLFSFILQCSLSAFSQVNKKSEKPLLDIEVFGKWPFVSTPAVSDNGKYFSYELNNEPLGRHTLVIQSIADDWIMKFPDAGKAAFTSNSLQAIFLLPGDSLCMLKLGSSDLVYKSDVISFRLFFKNDIEWLLYQRKTSNRELALENLTTNEKQIFTGVDDFLLADGGMSIILKSRESTDHQQVEWLNWVDITNGKNKIIWKGAHTIDLTLDKTGTQLAFVAEDEKKSLPKRSLYYYKKGDNQVELLAYNEKMSIEDLELAGITRFSNDGERLYLELEEIETIVQPSNEGHVDVWSFTDDKLQSQQRYELFPNKYGTGGLKKYLSVFDIKSRSLFRLQNYKEEIRLFDNKNDTIAVVVKQCGNKPLIGIMNTKTGQKTVIKNFCPYLVSPEGKYIIGSDSTTPYMDNTFSYLYNNIISYDLATKKLTNLTKSFPTPRNEVSKFGWGCLKERGLTVAAWLTNDQGLLVYDKYDIWLIEMSTQKSPVCLTNGYGRKNNIVFRLPFGEPKSISNFMKLTISAFDEKNKNNGYYSMIIGYNRNPELLSMGPFIYDAYSSSGFSHIFPPIKAKDSETYIVERQNAFESPNYFWTYNFVYFYPLTHNYPEMKYNWFHSEIVRFKMPGGQMESGALYIPENFDRKKKYPIIFCYYRILSDRLNEYREPEPCDGSLETCIPYFVSNGYLVFTPDIYYETGRPGKSALNTVVAAANYFSKVSFVDSKKMGIQGHSFGGFETNYIVTHSSIFRAACTSSGLFDFIGGYGSLTNTMGSKKWQFDFGPYQIGHTLWQRRDLYIENSPIFRADKVSTPLLMMATPNDKTVPFAQSVAFFTALQSLGKKVWLLQYDDGEHTVSGISAIDFTIRLKQFFDYYLKEMPPPHWMTNGIPARTKGVDDGLTLDKENKPNVFTNK